MRLIDEYLSFVQNLLTFIGRVLTLITY